MIEVVRPDLAAADGQVGRRIKGTETVGQKLGRTREKRSGEAHSAFEWVVDVVLSQPKLRERGAASDPELRRWVRYLRLEDHEDPPAAARVGENHTLLPTVRAVLWCQVDAVDECRGEPLIEVVELRVLGAITGQRKPVQARRAIRRLVATMNDALEQAVLDARVAVDELLIDDVGIGAMPLVLAQRAERIAQADQLRGAHAVLEQRALRVQHALWRYTGWLDLDHVDTDAQTPSIEVDDLAPDLEQIADELLVSSENARELNRVAEQEGIDPLPRASGKWVRTRARIAGETRGATRTGSTATSTTLVLQRPSTGVAEIPADTEETARSGSSAFAWASTTPTRSGAAAGAARRRGSHDFQEPTLSQRHRELATVESRRDLGRVDVVFTGQEPSEGSSASIADLEERIAQAVDVARRRPRAEPDRHRPRPTHALELAEAESPRRWSIVQRCRAKRSRLAHCGSAHHGRKLVQHLVE